MITAAQAASNLDVTNELTCFTVGKCYIFYVSSHVYSTSCRV